MAPDELLLSDSALPAPDDLPDDIRGSYRPRRGLVAGRNAGTVPSQDDHEISFWAVKEAADIPLPVPPRKRTTKTVAIVDDAPEVSPAKVPLDRAAQARAAQAQDEAPDATQPARRRPAAAAAYSLTRMLGRGGFGEVWESHQGSLERVVAVKRLRPDKLREKEASGESREALFEMFRLEAIITANLDHPNIVPVHDLGLDEHGMPMLAMKMVRGRPWHEIIIEDFPKMSPVDFMAKHLPILMEVTQAVAFAHSRGVIHRDLKPQQVMVGDYGETLLMDWGLSVVYDPEQLMRHTTRRRPNLPTPASATSPAGTVAFMAPEQTLPTADQVGPWTDIYLLGGILYCLLTGEVPHSGTDPKSVFEKARQGFVPSPHMMAPERYLCPHLCAIAMKALSPRPEDRYSSCEKLLDELKDYHSGNMRRNESKQITDMVAQTLETPAPEYNVYSEALVEIGRAETLWHDNPEVDDLRQRTFEQFSRLAIEHGDLNLARMLAENIDDTPEGRSLIRDIGLREFEARHRIRQRNLAVGAAGLLLILIIASGIFYGRQLSIERDEARFQRDSAREARLESDRLISFMLTDLQASLEQVGQLDPLMKVSDRVLDYFDRLPASERSPATDEQFMQALIAAAQIRYLQGDTLVAEGLLERARTIGMEHLRLATNKAIWGTNIAYSLVLSAAIRGETGDLEGAHQRFNQALLLAAQAATAEGALSASAIEQYRRDTRLQSPSLDDRFAADLELLGQIAQGFSHDPHWLEKMAFGYERIGDLLAKKGNLPLALLAHERALTILEHLGTLNQQDIQRLVVLYSNNMSIGDILRDMGNPADALPAYRRALALAQQASQMQPGNIMAMSAESQAWNRVGYALMLDGEDLRLAEETLSMAVQLGRAASLRDPTNVHLREHLANSLLGLARVSFTRNRLNDVREPVVQAVELTAALLAQNAGMVRWKGELRETLTLVLSTADRLIAMRSLNEADDLLTRVMAAIEDLRQQQPFTGELHQDWFNLFQRLVTVRIMQGRGQSALELIAPELEALDHLSVRTDLSPGDMPLVQSRLGTLALMAAAASAQEGRFELAFTWMRRAWLTRSSGLLPVLEVFPEPFQRLRDSNSSRYDLLVRRISELTPAE